MSKAGRLVSESRKEESRKISDANLILVKPGQVLNPIGRIKGSKNLTTILKALLEEDLTRVNQITGEMETTTIDAHLNTSLVANALVGEMKAQQMIRDRIQGKVIEKTEVVHDLKKVHDAEKSVGVKEF